MTATTTHTESLCPVCLTRIDATIRTEDGQTRMEKHCPVHGRFEAPVWRGKPAYESWQRPKIPGQPPMPLTRVRNGCPEDCGLCPNHRQRSCTIVMEVTQRCNLNCPVCYADASADANADADADADAKAARQPLAEPSLAAIAGWFKTASKAAPGANIQLSGGEPSLRDDLPAIVALGRTAGFEFVQLNTNGVRIAKDPAYLTTLKKAGLASVFLQFDAVDDEVYKRLRGRALLDIKLRAIEACTEAGIGVVLTPTLVPGVNIDGIGAILEKAVELSPTVRAVHFQPISYFGRYFTARGKRKRLTLPELMMAIETQSGGRFAAADFKPPGCENARCSFHARFLVLPEGKVSPLRGAPKRGCCGGAGPAPIPAATGAAKAMAQVRRQWAAPPAGSAALPTAAGCGALDGERPDLAAFISRARTHTLSVSAMAFQDAWNIDLERVRDCCIHVMAPDHRLIPFCLYNLTGSDGRRLYRQEAQ
jgi:uncharacterized radical SAM superfamily Fe-S cluster-containing enzyme